MKVHEPLSHWNNFTVPELKEILGHCVALERLGIAQDEKMMISIERDIDLRAKEISWRHVQRVQNIVGKKPEIERMVTQNTKQQPKEVLLEQTI
jgi:hypothetical protein